MNWHAHSELSYLGCNYCECDNAIFLFRLLIMIQFLQNKLVLNKRCNIRSFSAYIWHFKYNKTINIPKCDNGIRNRLKFRQNDLKVWFLYLIFNFN